MVGFGASGGLAAHVGLRRVLRPPPPGPAAAPHCPAELPSLLPRAACLCRCSWCSPRPLPASVAAGRQRSTYRGARAPAMATTNEHGSGGKRHRLKGKNRKIGRGAHHEEDGTLGEVGESLMATDLTKAADVLRLKKTIKVILHLRF